MRTDNLMAKERLKNGKLVQNCTLLYSIVQEKRDKVMDQCYQGKLNYDMVFHQNLLNKQVRNAKVFIA